jgi:hypothetical protein
VHWPPTADEWQTIANAATSFGVIASLGLGIWALLREGKHGKATAERAEAAARLTEDYTRRVVDALERMAEAGQGAARPRGVLWTLEASTGSGYMLKNEGDTDAENVTIKHDPTLRLMDQPPGGVRVGAREAITFLAAITFGTKDTTVTVQWNEPGSDETKEWRYPLPPKPPRELPRLGRA